MGDLETKLDHLRETIAAKREGYVLEGDALLAEIFEGMDPRALDGLLRSFDDSASYELMYSMIHAVEAWPDPGYCMALVEALPILWECSSDRAQTLHIRVLNSPSTLSNYLNVVDSTDASVRQIARRVFESISRNHPPLAEKTVPVLEHLSRSLQ